MVQEAVAAPIEAEVNGVDGMLSMSSTSANGGGYALTITFAVGTDPDLAAVNVQNRVAIAQSRLPQDVVRQGIVTRKQSSNMLMVVNLTSPEGTHDGLFLSNYASIHLQDALARGSTGWGTWRSSGRWTTGCGCGWTRTGWRR